MNNCLRYSDTIYCIECESGYVLSKNGNLCEETLVENCEIFESKDSCNKCN